MDRRRRGTEEPLHVRLGWRAPVDQRVGMDEREILTLPGREYRSRITNHTIRYFPRDSGGAAMNIRYRVELNEAERVQLTSMLSGGLAQYGGNRNRRVAWPMSGSPHRRAYPDTAKEMIIIVTKGQLTFFDLLAQKRQREPSLFRHGQLVLRSYPNALVIAPKRAGSRA